MRADLYSIALISALPEEHKLRSVSSSPRILNVGDNKYGIYAVFTESVPKYDTPEIEDAADQDQAIANQVAEICKVLKAGAGMIVVQRDLINDVVKILDPPPEVEPIMRTRFSSLEFLALFTQEEVAAIYSAAQSNIPLQIWKDRLVAADVVDVEDPQTIDGIKTLVEAKLLTLERGEEVLAGVEA